MEERRQMGLAATIAVVTGESIALGIFLTPAAMARSLGSPTQRSWRYVDGLRTSQPRDEAMYRERGKWLAREGYINVSKEYLPAQTAR